MKRVKTWQAVCLSTIKQAIFSQRAVIKFQPSTPTIQILTKIDHVKKFHTNSSQLTINQNIPNTSQEESNEKKGKIKSLLVILAIFVVFIGVEEVMHNNADERDEKVLESEDFQRLVNSKLTNFDDPICEKLLPAIIRELRQVNYIEMYQEDFIRNLFNLAAFSTSEPVKQSVIILIRHVFKSGSPRLAQLYLEYSFTDPNFSLVRLIANSNDIELSALTFHEIFQNKHLNLKKRGGILNDKTFQYHVLNILKNGTEIQKNCVIAMLGDVVMEHSLKKYPSPSVIFRNELSRILDTFPVFSNRSSLMDVICKQRILIAKEGIKMMGLSDDLKEIKEQFGVSAEDTLSNNEKVMNLKGKDLLISTGVALAFALSLGKQLKMKVLPVSALAFGYCAYEFEYNKRISEEMLARFHNSNNQLSNSEYHSNFKKFEAQRRMLLSSFRYLFWTGGFIVSPWVTIASAVLVDFRKKEEF